jgi:hypothetical protein
MTRVRTGPLRHLTIPLVLALTAVAVVSVVLVTVGSPVSLGVSTPQPQETTPDEETPAPSEAPAEVVQARVTSYEVFLARDPFEPVIPEAQPAAAGPTTSPTTSPTAAPTTSPTSSPTSPTSSPTTSPAPGGCVTGQAVSCDGQTVSLVDVFTEDGVASAVVQVNDTLYEVAANEVFADSYRVLSIEPPCVTLQYGDDRFSLCEGESVLK